MILTNYPIKITLISVLVKSYVADLRDDFSEALQKWFFERCFWATRGQAGVQIEFSDYVQ